MYTIIGGDGREYGPVTADQIRQWLQAGRANLDTQAKASGTEEWRPLGQFPEFSGNLPPPLDASIGAVPLQTDGPPLASAGARLLGFLIDCFLGCLCFIPVMVLISRPDVAEWAQHPNPETFAAIPGFLLGMKVSKLVSLGLLVVQAILLSLRGQTVGKFIVRTRIVRVRDGRPAGFLHAFLIRMAAQNLPLFIPILGFFYFLTDSCFVFRADRRCLHDLIAGTKVVSAV